MYYSLRVWLVEDIIALCPAKTSFTSLVVQKHGEEGPKAMFIGTIFAEKMGSISRHSGGETETALGSSGERKNIYIAGWTKNEMKPGQDKLLCEVYNETTNEWQFIRSFSVELKAFLGLIAVDGEVYVVGYYRPSVTGLLRVQCYDPESDEWKLKTEISIPWDERAQRQFKICDTMKVFQGSLSSSPCTSFSTQDTSQTRQTHHRRDKRKCSIV